MGNVQKREIIINKFDRLNGMPKFWLGGISPIPPWIRYCAHYENYLQTKAKRGEYTITIKKILAQKFVKNIIRENLLYARAYSAYACGRLWFHVSPLNLSSLTSDPGPPVRFQPDHFLSQ